MFVRFFFLLTETSFVKHCSFLFFLVYVCVRVQASLVVKWRPTWMRPVGRCRRTRSLLSDH